MIDQLCVFDRTGHENKTIMLVEDEELVCDTLPEKLLNKFKQNGIYEPWVCQYERGENDKQSNERKR